MTEVYNFAAGPAVLPASVIKQMQAELPSFKDSGMSVLEISHRSSLYEEMFHQAKSDLRQSIADRTATQRQMVCLRRGIHGGKQD